MSGATSIHASGSRDGTPALQLCSVSAGYSLVNVLHDLNIEVGAGECVAVLGPNGVGKTTVMRTIMGVVHPRTGTVHWQGRDIGGLPPHEVTRLGVAIVPEGRRLYGGMTVEENLQMGAFALDRRTAAGRLEQLYETFPLLKERREQLAGTLSGGQQQMCAIGRALMSHPSLLLIDELSLGLSPAAIRQVVEALKTAIDLLKPTTVVVDQDVKVAAEVASRGYFLDMGSVVASGPMDRLMEVELVRDLYFSAGSRQQEAAARG